MNMSEEDVQRQLRDLFSDERLGVRSTLNPETIVAGARRRRRRRQLMQTTTGMAAAVVMLGGGLTVFTIHDKDNGAVISADQLSLGPSATSQLRPGPGSQLPPPASPPVQTSQIPDAPQSSIPAGGPPKPPKSTSATKPPPQGKVTTGVLLNASNFGKLRLGMSADEAQAAGVALEKDSATETCAWYTVRSPALASVVVSQASGVELISPAGQAHTPEGIGTGSTEADVKAAYPGATKEAQYLYTAPTGPVSAYQIYIDNNGLVDNLQIANVNMSCSG